MRLIIDIPKSYYEYCKSNIDPLAIEVAIANGVTIDRLKAEIEEVAEKEVKYDPIWVLGLRYAINLINRVQPKNKED